MALILTLVMCQLSQADASTGPKLNEILPELILGSKDMRFVPECGQIALYALLKLENPTFSASIDQVGSKVHISPDGTSYRELSQAAARLAFNAIVRTPDQVGLCDSHRLFITCIERDEPHFVVMMPQPEGYWMVDAPNETLFLSHSAYSVLVTQPEMRLYVDKRRFFRNNRSLAVVAGFCLVVTSVVITSIYRRRV